MCNFVHFLCALSRKVDLQRNFSTTVTTPSKISGRELEQLFLHRAQHWEEDMISFWLSTFIFKRETQASSESHFLPSFTLYAIIPEIFSSMPSIFCFISGPSRFIHRPYHSHPIAIRLSKRGLWPICLCTWHTQCNTWHTLGAHWMLMVIECISVA